MGRMLWVTGEWPVFSASFHLFLFHKISVLFGPVSIEPQSHLVSECLFSLLCLLFFPCPSSLALLSFPSLCRLDYGLLAQRLIWTVYRVNMLSWFMRPLVAGASREQTRESPRAPDGLLGPGQYRSGEWLARMQVYCRHSTSLSSPVPVTPTPSCSFLLLPGLTKNVLSTVSPFPKTLGDGETMV